MYGLTCLAEMLLKEHGHDLGTDLKNGYGQTRVRSNAGVAGGRERARGGGAAAGRAGRR
jgi:hypothetical protein